MGMADILWRGALIGIGGTVLMDLWAILLHKLLGHDLPNWAPVGRWFWHLPKGRVFHDSIAEAEPFANELALGWIGHYAVGILYGVLLAAFMGSGRLAAPTFLPAFVWGILTVAAGWFLSPIPSSPSACMARRAFSREPLRRTLLRLFSLAPVLHG